MLGDCAYILWMLEYVLLIVDGIVQVFVVPMVLGTGNGKVAVVMYMSCMTVFECFL